MHLKRNLLILTLFAFGVAACAGTSISDPGGMSLELKLEQKGYLIGEPVDRIHNYRLNGWNDVDRYNVIIRTGPSRRYLVTLKNPCTGLTSAETIAFKTTTGSLTKFDSLQVRGSPGFVERCLIDSLHKLEKIEKAAVE